LLGQVAAHGLEHVLVAQPDEEHVDGVHHVIFSDQNGFGSTDLVLLDAMLQQRGVRWTHNLQTEKQSSFLLGAKESLQMYTHLQ